MDVEYFYTLVPSTNSQRVTHPRFQIQYWYRALLSLSWRPGFGSRLRRPAPGALDILVQGRFGDMHHLADLADGVLLFIVQFHGQVPLVPVQRLGPSAQASSGPRSPQACPGSLPDQIALELGESPEQVEYQLAGA